MLKPDLSLISEEGLGGEKDIRGREVTKPGLSLTSEADMLTVSINTAALDGMDGMDANGPWLTSSTTSS